MSARPQPEVLPLLHGWLRRAQQHSQASTLILRGSLVTRTLCGARRVAADVDYLVPGAFEPEVLAALCAEVAALPDAASMLILSHTEIIWADTPFPGLRAHLLGSVPDGPELPFQVDFACGDPLAQPPALLDVPAVGSVLACAPEILWAWKLNGLAEFGPGKWRAKDLYDLYLLHTSVVLDLKVLPAVVELAFTSRGMSLSSLDDFRTRKSWGCAVSSGRKWRDFGKRYGVAEELLAVRNEVRGLVERVVEREPERWGSLNSSLTAVHNP